MSMRVWIGFVMMSCFAALLLTGCQSPMTAGGMTTTEPIDGEVVETQRDDAGWSWLTGSVEAEAVAQEPDENVGHARSEAADADCPFRPAELQIHPLTRLLRSADGSTAVTSIEVRVELKDQFGDTTKGLGDLSFELLSRSNVGGVDSALLSWEPKFLELKANAAQFDRVTRTYVFTLDLSQGVNLPARCVLQARLLTHGATLTDRFEITFP